MSPAPRHWSVCSRGGSVSWWIPLSQFEPGSGRSQLLAIATDCQLPWQQQRPRSFADSHHGSMQSKRGRTQTETRFGGTKSARASPPNPGLQEPPAVSLDVAPLGRLASPHDLFLIAPEHEHPISRITVPPSLSQPRLCGVGALQILRWPTSRTSARRRCTSTTSSSQGASSAMARPSTSPIPRAMRAAPAPPWPESWLS